MKYFIVSTFIAMVSILLLYLSFYYGFNGGRKYQQRLDCEYYRFALDDESGIKNVKFEAFAKTRLAYYEYLIDRKRPDDATRKLILENKEMRVDTEGRAAFLLDTK